MRLMEGGREERFERESCGGGAREDAREREGGIS